MFSSGYCMRDEVVGLCVCFCDAHLEGIEAGDYPSVLDLAALGGVGKLALVGGAGAGTPLELAAHLQREPLGVPHVRHVHRHGNSHFALGFTPRLVVHTLTWTKGGK